MLYSIPLDSDDIELLGYLKQRKSAAVRYYGVVLASLLLAVIVVYSLEYYFNSEYQVYHKGSPIPLHNVLLMGFVFASLYFLSVLIVAITRRKAIDKVLHANLKDILTGVLKEIRPMKHKLIYCFADGSEVEVQPILIAEEIVNDNEFEKGIKEILYQSGQLVQLNIIKFPDKGFKLLKAVYPQLQFIEEENALSDEDRRIFKQNREVSIVGYVVVNFLLIGMVTAATYFNYRSVSISHICIMFVLVNIPLLVDYLASKKATVSRSVKTITNGVVTEITQAYFSSGRSTYLGTWYRINNELYRMEYDLHICIGDVVEYNSIHNTLTLK